MWKKYDISTASAQLFRNMPGRMRHFPTLCGKVCGKEVSFPQPWGKVCGKGVENAVHPSRGDGKYVSALHIFTCGCPVENPYSTPVDMSGFGGQRWIPAAGCGGSVRIFSTDRGGQPLSHTRPFFHRKCRFSLHSDSICPQKGADVTHFSDMTGHSTACPQSVHCLFHRSGPVACRKMPGQARIFGFSTVSRPLTAVTAERYTDRQIDCSP